MSIPPVTVVEAPVPNQVAGQEGGLHQRSNPFGVGLLPNGAASNSPGFVELRDELRGGFICW